MRPGGRGEVAPAPDEATRTTPEGAGAGETSPELAPGSRFGRFTVLEQLGAGGMGVVVAAHDPDLDRRVAIKVVRPDHARGDGATAARARMVREGKALARLSHPNVVTVHEVGQRDDRVFLVMELVDGAHLGRWLERPRPWREIVEVFVAAARGLAAVHAAGLIHRDVKPTNILIGHDGRVRVGDFGVVGLSGDGAAARRSSAMTPAAASALVSAEARTEPGVGYAPTRSVSIGALAGTPAYMAPEQYLNQPVDARADQWGFCVSLYEALYGVRPFVGGNLADLCLAVCAARVEVPDDRRDVPAWLHAIVVRGLARDPAARFPSMDALIAALTRDRGRGRRYALAGGATLALVGAAALVVATRGPREVAAGCGASADTLATRWGPLTGVRIQARFAAADPLHGADTFGRVQARLDRHAEAWRALHAETCRAQGPTFFGRMECLQRSRDEFAALVGQFGEGGEGMVERAVDAVVHLAPVDECAQASAAPPTRPDVARARGRIAVAEALTRTGAYDRAVVEAAGAVADAEATGVRSLVAEALLTEGWAHSRRRDPVRAEAALTRAAREAELAGEHRLAARSWTALVWVVGTLSAREAEALQLRPLAEEALRRAGDPHDVRAQLHLHVGSALIELGRYDDAVATLEQARAIWRDHLDPDDPELARLLHIMANVASYQGRLEQARDLDRQALELRERVQGPDHPELAVLLSGLARIELELGDLDASERDARRALDLSAAQPGGSRVPRAPTERTLARIQRERGDLAGAITALEAIAAASASVRLGAADNTYTWPVLGDMLVDAGDPPRALALCDEAGARFLDQGLSEHPDLASVETCQGRALLALGRVAEARTVLARADRRYGSAGVARERGITRLALARALAAPPAELERARLLAAEARALLVAAHADRLVAELDAWLASLGRRRRP